MDDYEVFVTELTDEAWHQLIQPTTPSRVYISGQKAYGVYKRLQVTADDVPQDWEFIGEIHSNNTRETVRAAIWQMFRRQPIYSAVSTLPIVALNIAA